MGPRLIYIGNFLLNALTAPDLILFVWYTAWPKARKELQPHRRYATRKHKREKGPLGINANKLFRSIVKDIERYQATAPWYVRVIPTVIIITLIIL